MAILTIFNKRDLLFEKVKKSIGWYPTTYTKEIKNGNNIPSIPHHVFIENAVASFVLPNLKSVIPMPWVENREGSML